MSMRFVDFSEGGHYCCRLVWYPLINIVTCINFHDLTHFRGYLGQKSKNNFVCFLVQMRKIKFASVIYWHLDIKLTLLERVDSNEQLKLLSQVYRWCLHNKLAGQQYSITPYRFKKINMLGLILFWFSSIWESHNQFFRTNWNI